METSEEISALTTIARCLSHIRSRAARRQLLEMIAESAIPLEIVEKAAALHYARQESLQLCRVQTDGNVRESSQPSHAEVATVALGDEMTGLSWRERISCKRRVRRAFEALIHLVALISQGVSFLLGGLGGLLVGGGFCGGLAILAFVLLRPAYVVDWQAFILDASLTHYIGWLALSVSGGILPAALVLPVRWAVGLFEPVRCFFKSRRLLRVLQQVQTDDTDPAALLRQAREQARAHRWHSDFCAALARVVCVGLIMLGDLGCVAGALVIVAKLFAEQLVSGELFWPIIAALIVLGYLGSALFHFHEFLMQSVDGLF